MIDRIQRRREEQHPVCPAVRDRGMMARRRSILFDWLEIGIILIVIFASTPGLREGFAGDTVPPGAEYPYLINSGALAAVTFQQNGAIPLWNPLMGRGEPLFESLFSYLLNPLMTCPILFWGVVQGGKIAILLHIGIMALGGWALGRALKLDAGGSALLGLLLAASGSFNTPLNRGFYQIGLSLAYVPWVYAGLIGLLYREQVRRWTGVFVAALALMFFAGTYWFVVPTGIGCAVIALFALVKPESRRLAVERFRRLVVAGGFALGFAALSLITHLNSWLVYHPAAGLGGDTYDLLAILQSFFVPDKLIPSDWWFAYHYTIPGWFALVVVGARLVLVRLGSPFARWRILIPAGLLILFFCVWAQGNTPLFAFIYEHSFLVQWRWTPRMAAAATPFVALIAAIWFDEAVSLLARRGVVLKLGAVTLAGAGLYAASLVYWNWEHMFQFEPDKPNVEYGALVRLRSDYPGAMLPVLTEGLLPHLVAHDLLIRSALGNPDVFTNGLPASPGLENAMPRLAQFAVAYNERYDTYLRDRGFLPYPDSPLDEGGDPALWYNPDALPYAFVVQRDTLPASIDNIRFVAGMAHHLDRIDLTLGEYEPDSLLVVQEIDYPGWSASIDGQPAEIESFDGLMAVSLPPGAQTVVFEYHAPLLAVGALVYSATLIAFAGYLLRLDVRLRRRRGANSPPDAAFEVVTTGTIIKP